jgi:hypothetical protein
MATAKKIQSDISSLKVAIRVAKNDAIKKKLKSRLEMAENELASIKSGAKPRKVSTSGGTKSLLQRAKELVKKNKKFASYKGSGVDLEKDAKEGAFAIGRRVSKGIKGNQFASKDESKGNVYYEYRVNRLDVKQPKKKQTYPKLEDGGMMARGGYVSKGELVWKKLSGSKKMEFLEENFKKQITDRSKEILVNKDFQFLPKDVKIKFEAKYANVEEYADGGMMAKGGKLEVGVYRVGKPTKVSPMLYEQKIVEIFGNGDIATASDYGRKLSDFNLQKYPIISKEQLDAQYKMAYGGYMAKGGEIIPYIIWVSKDGEKREFYGEYKSQRAAEMAMKKLWDSSDYKAMGNKPKKMYEKDGFYKYGGYMAKGGVTKGDVFVEKDEDYERVYKVMEVRNDNGKKTFVMKDTNGNIEYFDNKKLNKLTKKNSFTKFEDGGMMAKGGALEHGLKEGDKIVSIGITNIIIVENGGKLFVINLNVGKRWSENQWKNLDHDNYGKYSKMAHGGETHRAEDPEVEIDEEEMKVVRGYSDDEAYEYAKGGMTLKAGDIVEATTGVKLKVMDFKPDFGGRALVQRIDEFGEGLKPAWMPLTKFKLPKLI